MEQKHQFPAEEVTLPSKGLLYPQDSSLKDGILEIINDCNNLSITVPLAIKF